MIFTMKNNYSPLVTFFNRFVEFGNRYFTLGGFLFRTDENVFTKIELMSVGTTALAVLILFFIEYLPYGTGLAVCVLLLQRIFEYFIVYSRNFILSRGRVFTHFEDKKSRGEWLVLMFQMNLFQIIVIFGIWYHFLSIHFPGAFSQSIGILDAVYFSIITFFTTGYGDITPVSNAAKVLTMFESMLAFYTLLIVINGLISLHFNAKEDNFSLEKEENLR